MKLAQATSTPEGTNGTDLIVYWPKVNIGFKRFTSNTACQHILSCVTEPILNKNPAHIFNLEERDIWS